MAALTADVQEFDALKGDLAREYFRRNNSTFIQMFRQEVPVDTGRLQSRHRGIPPFKRGRYWTMRWVAPTGYDIFVHQGRRNTVRTRGAKVQRIKSLSVKVLAVTAGGHRANPWFVRSFQRLGLNDVRWIRSTRT